MPIQLLMVVAERDHLRLHVHDVHERRFLESSAQEIQIHGELVNVKWSDVIGMENVKAEAREVVELIKDRARVKKIGGKILRGILMLGPPGCGKTYLAKAIATETGLPFMSMSGSEFVEIFVGVGAVPREGAIQEGQRARLRQRRLHRLHRRARRYRAQEGLLGIRRHGRDEFHPEPAPRGDGRVAGKGR